MTTCRLVCRKFRNFQEFGVSSSSIRRKPTALTHILRSKPNLANNICYGWDSYSRQLHSSSSNPACTMIHAVSSTDVLEIEKKRRLSGSGTTMTTNGSCGYLASLGGSGSGSGDEGDSMEISPSAATGPSRPVIKRSSSLGHSSTFLVDGSAGDDENAVPQTTSTDVESSDDEQQTRAEAPGLLRKLGLRRSNSASDILGVGGGGDTNATAVPAAALKFKATPTRFHHRCTMQDSVHVQIRHQKVLDDEKHEENPHLQDYLKPKKFHMSTRESQNNLLHLETQYLRSRPVVVAEEESSDDETENDDLTPPKVSQDVIDADAAASIAAGADEIDVERTEVHDEPIRAVAQKKFDPNEPLRSCMKKAWGQDTERRKPKKNVIFHEVTVRDYRITLGDHPAVSYGPPITLSWDYLEYDPLNIDEYEIHHPKRRTLRQMGLNYYQRRSLLLRMTDYTDEELRLAWKRVKKAKQQRYITRHYTSAFPVRLVEGTCQSAMRKVKKTMSGGGKHSGPILI